MPALHEDDLEPSGGVDDDELNEDDLDDDDDDDLDDEDDEDLDDDDDDGELNGDDEVAFGDLDDDDFDEDEEEKAMGIASEGSALPKDREPARSKGGARSDDDMAADRLSRDGGEAERGVHPHQDELLDEGVEETFPASDPVSVKRIT